MAGSSRNPWAFGAPSPASKYRADIDGLRAVAVLCVVLFHAYPDALTGGFIGVDVFFVISGFLISTILLGSLEGGTFSFLGFYARRVRRIFPALLLVLAACFGAGWVFLLPDEYRQLGKHMAAGAGFVSNFALWSEAGYFDAAAATKPLQHLWSLGIEEQFYALWPLVVWLAWQRGIALTVVAGVVAAASFGFNVWGIGRDVVGTFYSPHTRLWELSCGAMLAWFRALAVPPGIQGGPMVRLAAVLDRPHLLSACGALALACGAWWLDGTRAFPGGWALVPVLATLALIAAGPTAWFNRVVLSHPVVVWVGLVSFPLYLWHWAILSFLRTVEGEAPSLAHRTAAVVLSIGLAWATYAWVERPVRFGPRGGVKAAALVVLMLIVGGAGYLTFERQGFADRFPPLIRELTQYQYDYDRGYRTGRCFLQAAQDYTAFETCDPAPPAAGRPVVVLWGDSHAAHLYQGFLAALGQRVTLVQRTSSGCAPIVGLDVPDRKHCRAINDHVLAVVESLRPQRIVLAAQWSRYELDRLDDTVRRLKAMPNTEVDLVGPVPEWKGSLPRQLYNYQRTHWPRTVPSRMSFGLDAAVVPLDAKLRLTARSLNVRYWSPRDVLCDAGGCLTRLGETGDSLVAWDYGHFTEQGSRFVVAGFLRP